MIKSKVSCIIVTYNPGAIFYELVKRIEHKEINIIIIDNSSVNVFSDMFKNRHLTYWMKRNAGIAAAQNKGIEKAIEAKSECIAFLDQDSKLEAQQILELVETVNNEEYSIAAPISINRNTGSLYSPVRILDSGYVQKIDVDEAEILKTNFAISSGTVVKTSVLSEVGPMDDSLFIDYVDTEWCLRAHAKGYSIAINTNVKMEHEIGDGDINCYFFNVPVHSPQRRYYRVRNAVSLFRYSHFPKRLALREVFVTGLQQLILICLTKNRREYLTLYFKAVKAGLKSLRRKKIFSKIKV